MKSKFLSFLAIVWFCASSLPAFAQPTNPALLDDFKALVGRINEKIVARQTNETAYADEIRQFDVLLDKYKDADAQDRQQILMMKAQLFLDVIPDSAKALAVFQQFKQMFPGVNPNGNNIDDIIASLQRQAEAQSIQRALAIGTEFPLFNETDLNGKPLSLASYKGKVVLVDFWATWCVPCLVELPNVIRTYEKYRSQGFEVIGVNLDHDIDRARLVSFIEDKKLPWQQYFDGKYWTNKLALKYGIMKLPTAYLLNREGKIVAINPHGEELERAVASEVQSGFRKLLGSVDLRIRKSPYLAGAVTFLAGLLIGVMIRRKQVGKNSSPKAGA